VILKGTAKVYAMDVEPTQTIANAIVRRRFQMIRHEARRLLGKPGEDADVSARLALGTELCTLTPGG
jgi:hypothetical protein